MSEWAFLTNHTRVLLCIARDPRARMRDIAECTGLTEGAVKTLVGDLCAEGYLSKHRIGARNRYELHPELPLRGTDEGDHRVGEILTPLLEGTAARTGAAA